MGAGMETDKIQLKVLLVSLGAVILMGLLEVIGMRSVPRENGYLVLGAVRLVNICILVLIVIFIGDGLASVGLIRREILRGFKRGLLWSAAFGVVTSGVFLCLYLAGVNPFKLLSTSLPERPWVLIHFLVVGAVIAPLAEELFFRGILYGFFRRWGIINALILSTTIFVGLHAVSGIPVTQAVGGIVFALSYEIEKNLMVPITIHVLGNSAIFGISMVSRFVG